MRGTTGTARRAGRCARRGRERGSALVIVVTAFAVLLVVVCGTLSFAVAGARSARQQQDQLTAEAAARSGLQDLLTKLRANPRYFSDTLADPDGGKGLCQNPAAPGPEQDTDRDLAKACGWDAGTAYGWAPVASGPDAGRFHYDVLRLDADGPSAVIRSTGTAGGLARTVVARVGGASTSDFLYWSDYELADPSDRTTYPRSTDLSMTFKDAATDPMKAALAACGTVWSAVSGGGDPDAALPHAWQRDATGHTPDRMYVDPAIGYTACRQPVFASGDVLEGRVHSNDLIGSKGGTFRGQFTAANYEGQGCDQAANYPLSCLAPGSRATFETAGAPKPARVDLSGSDPFKGLDGAQAAAQSSGCVYKGATRIAFQGRRDGSGRPLMRVWSLGGTDSPAARCGATADLASAQGVLVPYGGADYVVYVADDPSAKSVPVPSGALGTLTGPGGQTAPFPQGTFTDPDPAHATGLVDAEAAMLLPGKYRPHGNAFVEGVAQAPVTVASAADTVILGDLLTPDSASAVVGLSAGGAVEVYNPVKAVAAPITMDGAPAWTKAVPEGAYPVGAQHWDVQVPGIGTRPAAGDGLTVMAAVRASAESFRVQNWNEGRAKDGSPLSLYLYGSIGQRFRGVTGAEDGAGHTVGGYAKRYVYNPTLDYLRPPRFPGLTSSSWGIVWSEVRDTPAAAGRAAKAQALPASDAGTGRAVLAAAVERKEPQWAR
ncbi:MAG: hypothetical protein LBM66_07560 [Bifidobacteriaceae bacterium]|jgi:hypothetical protein|nr:hypothetical protein [Bifidobacteriaceae bacterium]